MNKGLVSVVLASAVLLGCGKQRYDERSSNAPAPVELGFKLTTAPHYVAAQRGSHDENSDAAYMASIKELSFAGRKADADGCIYRRFDPAWFGEYAGTADAANERMLVDTTRLAYAFGKGETLTVLVLPSQRTHGGCYILTQTPSALPTPENPQSKVNDR